MNDYINKAVQRYSSLFKLPSHTTLLLELLVVCLFFGFMASMPLKSYPYNLAMGLALGVIVFALNLTVDYIVHTANPKTDPVFNWRRCSALSVYSLMFWSVVLCVGVAADFSFPGIWFRFFLLGFCSALALRLLVYSAVSFVGIGRILLLSILLPAMDVAPVAYTALTWNAIQFDFSILVFFVVSIIVTAGAILSFIFAINRVGKQIIGVDSLSVLKAFLATWTEDMNEPFERLFARFSQEHNIELSVLSFRRKSGDVKALMVVPAFHPGPFKNLGSSDLPYTIQKALESKMGVDCVVAVPHGLSGHDLDLATQEQNQLVLQRVLELSDVKDFGSGVSQCTRIKKNGASATCQVFNKCALVALTLAPETMEDLPVELNSAIIKSSKKNGFSTAITVDAHNSIHGPFKIEEAIGPLEEASSTSLQRASKTKAANFEVGVAKVMADGFGLKEGMGPGGVIALIVRVGEQTTAYITIDGNNMVSGLRERILSTVNEMGVDEGEVFTTDTHAVNAVVLDARGYHPVGEAIDHETLIKYIKEATARALANLEPAEVGWRTETVPNVRVIGESQIQALCMLVDRASKRARNAAITILPIAAGILAALLMLL
jgi:putative membrane protein